MVNRRIFEDEPDPPPQPEAGSPAQETPSKGKEWYEDVELAREWGKLADKGIFAIGKVVGAIHSGEIEKLRAEVRQLFVDLQSVQNPATGASPPSNGASNNGPAAGSDSEPSASQSPASKGEVVNMERRIDLGKLAGEIEKTLNFLAGVPFMADKQLKELPAMFQENKNMVMKEVAKAIESSMVYVEKSHAAPQS